MKKVGGILLALLISLTFLGCIAPKGEGHNIGLAVEFNDHAACAYVAKEKGWYEDAGLDLTSYESYQTGLMLSAALARGDIQAAYICLSPAILACERGVPLKIVCGTHKYGYGLVAAPEIKDIAHLEGKTIGCMREGSPVDLLFHLLVQKCHLEDIKVRRMSPEQGVIALTTGSLEAAFLPEHYATVAESQGYPMLIQSQELWPNMQGSVLVVKTKLIENNPEDVRKLVEVTQKGTDWIKDYPDETAQIMGGVLETPAEVIGRSMNRLSYSTKIDPKAVQDTIDLMAELGYIGEDLRAEDILDLRFQS
jgi:NitT/TauT family transport system substrate-binding protein